MGEECAAFLWHLAEKISMKTELDRGL